ncbi:hypothetical protein [Kineosporia sp. NBRC 101731]|uniref:hypothetical protein n=1 Tax=Kineosporia sp. NBRC 101731 TaxID=3032199 RepID=UPI0024A06CB3|nr:hypothetical protein [Kineosporia sp. NBRC 101731]GLY28309.1 hypothetical protein Kisp02_16740 [Kineosporia sp. NBRC 101731]
MAISHSSTALVPVTGVVGVYLNKRTGEPVKVPIVAFSPETGQTFYVDRNGKVVDYRLSREDDVWSVGVFAAGDTEGIHDAVVAELNSTGLSHHPLPHVPAAASAAALS